MNAARIVALTDIRIRAIDQASRKKSEMRARARACPCGTPALRSNSKINVARYRNANQSTAQK
jgi:hypothetical protein